MRQADRLRQRTTPQQCRCQSARRHALLLLRLPSLSRLQMLMLLDGSWKLVYTSNSELLAILALSRLPFVGIGDITQRIDSATNTVENKVAISVPLSRTSLSTTASFEVRSPKRLQVRFEKGAIQVRLLPV